MIYLYQKTVLEEPQKSGQKKCFPGKSKGFPGGSAVKNLPANAGHVGSIPGSGFPGGGNGNPLQYSCLKNPMDKGAWRATVCGFTVRHN